VALAWLRTDPVAPDPSAAALIEVRGAVPRPGLHLVPGVPGAGAGPGVPTVDLALASAGAAPIGDGRALRPGDRIVLGLAGVEIRAPSDPVLVGRRLDPNQADAAALAAVPGLGDRTAEAIVADRAERGPFRSVEDLRRVAGIGAHTLAELAPHVRIGAVPPVDLNRATARELEALPGIGPSLASRIVADREVRGPYPDLPSLQRVSGIGPATIARLDGIAMGGVAGSSP
jgi:competence ComEA-like helix-hairpin-helix protein